MLYLVKFGCFPSGPRSCLISADSKEEAKGYVSEYYSYGEDKWQETDEDPVYDYKNEIYTYTIEQVELTNGILHRSYNCC